MLDPGGPHVFLAGGGRKEVSRSCAYRMLPTAQLWEGSDLSYQNLYLGKESAETPGGISSLL